MATDVTGRGRQLFRRQRQTVQTQERQLVPVPSLEHDLIILNMEKAASSQAERVPPLKYGPLPIFEQVLHDTRHLGCGEFFGKLGSNRISSSNRRTRSLMVHSSLAVVARKQISVSLIKRLDPRRHHFTRPHDTRTF
jgi:hypothetical protein